ncbi:cobalamin biosynthesis protein CbiA [Desulfobacter hydrogenophilus]|uniref:Cobalamin biosynthesis protein CbiA n=1 Tax=Desulfobacter hydrogenophilus TaxID=2291 RepID=A0A328FA57_9BACT|nr:cobalamin biosynthesis protein CbiA [Desulfobacter hydrogenophilus]NDY74003.1 cobalamin biosynthesis protein CbiA [Desulfobacter hydrogenophilus]QBH12732.1 cobalamin biosynthesis protein CbiA [Desulfobacter hydrogenophilus]RAM00292.1 cobalamin biosynthesis protein CbiA [Desulfobacter hydrogenophilus]
MLPDISGIIIIVGNYGSGKSETAVNLAVVSRRAGKSVKITDLDLVNPYFRSREAKKPLEDMGVEVVLPDRKYMHADLPILTPAVADMIKNPAQVTILDAGGDDAGVTVLAALADVLKKKQVKLLQVINPLRPNTQDVQSCLKIKAQIEAAAKLPVTGLISNANLLDETTPQIIYDGYNLVRRVSEATGLNIEFITASTRLLPQLAPERIFCPILPIDRLLALPWTRT